MTSILCLCCNAALPAISIPANPTSRLHEAYLKLIDPRSGRWEHRTHFITALDALTAIDRRKATVERDWKMARSWLHPAPLRQNIPHPPQDRAGILGGRDDPQTNLRQTAAKHGK